MRLLQQGTAADLVELSTENAHTFVDKHREPFTTCWRQQDGDEFPAQYLVPRTGPGETGQVVKFGGPLIQLREKQTEWFDEWFEHIQAGRSGQLRVGTGHGKSTLALEAIRRYGRRALFVVIKINDLKQIIAEAPAVLGDVPIGVIQGNQYDVDKPVVVATVQTLARDRITAEHLQGFGLAILDENDKADAQYWQRALFKIGAGVRWGMSATDRKDGRDIVSRAHLGELIVRHDGIQLPPTIYKYLSPHETDPPNGVAKIKSRDDMMRLRTRAITALVKNEQRNAECVRFIQRLAAKGYNVIAFTDRVEHCKQIAGMCRELGIDSVALHGKASELSKRKAKRSAQVIPATYPIADRGLNIPRLDACVLLTPRADVIQCVGRIRREFDKNDPVVIDIVDRGLYSTMSAKGRDKWYRAQQFKIQQIQP